MSEYYYNSKILSTQELKNIFEVSFPNNIPQDSWLADKGVLKVTEWETIDSINQIIEPGAGAIVDGEWKTYQVRDKTNSERWADLRNKRDKLLNDSDFTQLDDSPRNRATWKTYRALLRSIPVDYPNPDDVVWPTQPSTPL
jgi:hypothetical protein